MELTILMPCLNEAETLKVCIDRATAYLRNSQIIGEVLIADNGSNDGSQEIAEKAGARVIHVHERGYGAALIAGINDARGKFVVMGDSDDSYDFSRLDAFLEKLRGGAQLVVGNRFQGGIEKGAMPPLHRYLGNPVLSFIGRLLYRIKLGDFHCGLRAFDRDSVKSLRLQATGMEFASEMIVKAKIHSLRIDEVPTTLRPDGRNRPPHLRSWRDGWRHLRFLLIHSPAWLFLYPGILLLMVGLLGQTAVLSNHAEYFGIAFGIHTLLYAGVASVLGLQMCMLSVVGRISATHNGILPHSERIDRFNSFFTLERGLIVGATLALIGLTIGAISVKIWVNAGLGPLVPELTMRYAIPSAILVMAGAEIGMFSFMLGLINTKDRSLAQTALTKISVTSTYAHFQ